MGYSTQCCLSPTHSCAIAALIGASRQGWDTRLVRVSFLSFREFVNDDWVGDPVPTLACRPLDTGLSHLLGAEEEVQIA